MIAIPDKPNNQKSNILLTKLDEIPTPCFAVDESLLLNNLTILNSVQQRTGCKILMALKAFSMFSMFPLISKYLYGVAASSLNEARLGYEKFAKEVHLYAPAYIESEFDQLLSYCDHIVFNSFSQWKLYGKKSLNKGIRCGIRVNPEHSEVKFPIYNPCAPFSRFGVTFDNFEFDQSDGISGLHFHTLCELNADSLIRTLNVVEKKFSKFLKKVQWVNFGGGHLITRNDYNIDLLCQTILDFKNKYPVEVYLEPGEAVALNTGFLVASVLDIIHNQTNIAILDTSAAAHMPDILEMPYRPEIIDAKEKNELPFTYRLTGMTCLSGDVIGDYSFDKPLSIGSKIAFKDMAHYTMVKTNNFNGVGLPSIGIIDCLGNFKLIKRFCYEDFLSRLS